MSDFPTSIRKPAQERSAARVARVVEAAERLLEQLGPEKTSIPAIAAAADVPRAAIYPFFPDKYALFSHLARQHMDCLTARLATLEGADSSDWRGWVQRLIEQAADYYNSHPVASILLLRGTWNEIDHEAHAAKNRSISSLTRTHLQGLAELPRSPDVAMLAVEIAFACMKHGYAEEGRISPAICHEATRAALAYLAPWQLAEQ